MVDYPEFSVIRLLYFS